MTRLVLVALGALAGIITTVAWTQGNREREALSPAAIAALRGAHYSYGVVEEFDMSIGLDGQGRHRKANPIEEVRHHLNVPGHYGKLVEITLVGDTAILWFRDGEGLIRNAIVQNASTQLYRIQCFETQRYQARWIRD